MRERERENRAGVEEKEEDDCSKKCQGAWGGGGSTHTEEAERESVQAASGQITRSPAQVLPFSNVISVNLPALNCDSYAKCN